MIDNLQKENNFYEENAFDLDFQLILTQLKRNKKLFFRIILSSLLLSIFYIVIKKPIWEADFQIVIDSKDEISNGRVKTIVDANPLVGDISGFNALQKRDLKTQVETLKSSSLLYDVYQYVKEKRNSEGVNTKKWSFKKWSKKHVNVELINQTSVINVSYQDKGKDHVSKVADLISKKYQVYSDRERQDNLDNGIAYLKNQVAKRRKIYFDSMKEVQEYALKNDLGLRDELNIYEKLENLKTDLKLQKERLQKAKSSKEYSLLIARQIDEVSNYFNRLQSLESTLSSKLSTYKENDKGIIMLKREIKVIEDFINKKTIQFMKANLEEQETNLNALNRPKEIILKHRELVKKKSLDEKIYNELESQLQSFILERAKKVDPWELITKPSLSDEPIKPKKLLLILLSSIFGVLSGSLIIIILEKNKGLLISKKQISNSIGIEPLIEYDQKSDLYFNDFVENLQKKDIYQGKQIMWIVPEIDESNELLNKFYSVNNIKDFKTIKSLQNNYQLFDEYIYLLLASPGFITNAEIRNLKQTFKLSAKEIDGWILIK